MPAKTLRDFMRERMGVSTTPVINPLISSVGTTATRLFRQNPNAVALLIVNLSTVAMYAGPFINPSSSRGITIGAGGGNLSLIWFEDFELVGMEWYIVADAAASNLFSVQYLTQVTPEVT